METTKMMKFITSVFIVVLSFVLIPPLREVHAATSPDLGNAASFAILAGTSITNVPTSVITGDVGLSPAAGSNYSGLTNNEVSGTIFAVDSSGPAGSAGNNPTLVNQAKIDLVTAYNALAAGANADANCDPAYTFGAGNKDLTGASLAPGVYCADTFTLTGTLTLSGSGVWVFRSAATLVTSGTANIVGGDPCNVWWQVPSSATLGTNTSLKGNILALSSITMNTGAAVTGRILARNAAVSLQSNTINQSCTAGQAKASGSSNSSGSSASSGSSTAPAAKTCPVLNFITPIIIESKRVDPSTVFISWGPYSGINTFIVRYGLENGKWLYNTGVTGFSTTIGGLPLNQPIWVQIATTDNCSIGTYGDSKLVGGPALPNTGVGPHERSILSDVAIPGGIIMLIVTSLIFLLTTRLNQFELGTE